jgi:hypothetical protein
VNVLETTPLPVHAPGSMTDGIDKSSSSTPESKEGSNLDNTTKVVVTLSTTEQKSMNASRTKMSTSTSSLNLPESFKLKVKENIDTVKGQDHLYYKDEQPV